MRLASSEFDRITTFLVEYFGIRSVWDVFRIIIDILMISYVFYLLITLLRDSRAFQLIKGVILILLAAFVSDLYRFLRAENGNRGSAGHADRAVPAGAAKDFREHREKPDPRAFYREQPEYGGSQHYGRGSCKGRFRHGGGENRGADYF